MPKVLVSAPSNAFGDWEHQICETFVPLRVRSPGDASETFRGAVTSSNLGAITLAEVRATQACVERTPTLIRRADPEFYKFGLQVSGTCVIEQGDRQALLNPGDSAIYDTSRPYRVGFSDNFRMVVAMFPREHLALPDAKMAGLTAVRLPGTSRVGGLIGALMRNLSESAMPLDGGVGAHLGDAVLDLVTAALTEQLGEPTPRPPTPKRRLATEVYTFIERNLTNPDLRPHDIADAHFVSLRQIQKALEGEGDSVAAAIRSRRLDRCRRDLSNPSLTCESIASIAARWGFLDPAHFSRLFRAAFGISPREFRQREVLDNVT